MPSLPPPLKTFLRSHIIKLLSSFSTPYPISSTTPFDLHINTYFKKHKHLGSHDRRQIGDLAYKILRFKVMLERDGDGWTELLQRAESGEEEDRGKNENLPLHIRCSCPKPLFNILKDSYGELSAFNYCRAMLEKAPLTIRANPIKTTRDQDNLYQLEEFKSGLFEIQDEASQLASLQIEVQPGQRLLDYCAGSGGKTLAVAHLTKNTGQIYLHDVRPRPLSLARQRLSRAGVQNVQFAPPSLLSKNFFDYVVLDVPCSGSGTYRRNPDLKLKFEEEGLGRLGELQEGIVGEGVEYLRKGGKLVYITCSLLPQENILQVKNICSKFGLIPDSDSHFQSFPEPGGMDSFFAIRLKKA